MSLKDQANSRCGVAIISGGFALMVALVSGLFSWLGDRQKHPDPPAPTLAMGTVSYPVVVAGAIPQSLPMPGYQAGLPASSTIAPIPSQEPLSPVAADPRLNFVAYQAVMKDRSLSPQVKRQTLDRCLDQTVVWEGYVDERVTMAPDAEARWTVVLCENPQLISQTLFTMPAHCRFTDDPDGRVTALRRGQRVTIIGRFSNHNVVATEIVDCRLSAVHDD